MMAWDCLEDRTVLSSLGSSSSVLGSTSSSSSTSSATTAIQTLQGEVQAIEQASGTTVGELTTIASTFRTLASDGLVPSSRSALASFENNLVTANANDVASGTTLAQDTTQLPQFEALFTSNPANLSATQTTDLTNAYNALAAAVASAGITQANINSINTDFAAVLAATNRPSTVGYPYFPLVSPNIGLTSALEMDLGSFERGDLDSRQDSQFSSALQTLQGEVQTIEQASGTTVGQLTTLLADFQTLANDGLVPNSTSALLSFENSLVTANAGNTTLANNQTLLPQFVALYTSGGQTLTQTQNNDLTKTYNDLAAAVTSAGITQADINAINQDWSAVLASRNSTSTATYPYFSLVAGNEFGGVNNIPARQTGGSGTGGGSVSSLRSALQTLQSDIRTIEQSSGTTVGNLFTIASTFRTLARDGLVPSSVPALVSFENSLVTANANAVAGGSTLAAQSSTLLPQFEALFTSNPANLTQTQTTDLTNAYNALAAAVASAGITQANINTINTDWAAVLAAENAPSTVGFPYFSLVTTVGGGLFGGGPGGGHRAPFGPDR